jgi:chromosome segregation ATPase
MLQPPPDFSQPLANFATHRQYAEDNAARAITYPANDLGRSNQSVRFMDSGASTAFRPEHSRYAPEFSQPVARQAMTPLQDVALSRSYLGATSFSVPSYGAYNPSSSARYDTPTGVPSARQRAEELLEAARQKLGTSYSGSVGGRTPLRPYVDTPQTVVHQSMGPPPPRFPATGPANSYKVATSMQEAPVSAWLEAPAVHPRVAEPAAPARRYSIDSLESSASVHSLHATDLQIKERRLPSKQAPLSPAPVNPRVKETVDSNFSSPAPASPGVLSDDGALASKVDHHVKVRSLLGEVSGLLQQLEDAKTQSSEVSDAANRKIEQLQAAHASEIEALHEQLQQCKLREQQHIAELDEQRQQFESQLAGANEQKNQAIQRAQEVTQSELKAAAAHHGGILQDFQSELQEARFKAVDLEGHVTQITSERDNVYRQAMELNAELDNVKSMLADTRQQCELLEAKGSATEGSLRDSMSRMVANHRSDIDSLREAMQQQHAEHVQSLRQSWERTTGLDMEKLRGDLAILNDELRHTQQIIATSKERESSQAEELRRTREAIAEMQSHARAVEADANMRVSQAQQDEAAVKTALERTTKELENLRDNNRQELLSLRSQLATQSVEYENSQTAARQQITQLQTDQDILLTKCASVEDECDNLRKQRLEADNRINELTQDLSSCLSERDKQADEITNLHQQLEHSINQLQQSRSQLTTANDKAAASEKESYACKQQTRDAQSALYSLEDRLQALQADYNRLKERHTSQQSQLATTTAQLEASQRELQLSNTTRENETSSMAKCVDTIRDDLAAAARTLAEQQSALHSERLKCSSLQTKADNLQRDGEKYRHEAHHAVRQLQETQHTLHAAERRVTELSAELTSKTIQLEASTAWHTLERELSEQLAVAMADNEQKADVIAALTHEVAALKCLVADQNASVVSLTCNVEELTPLAKELDAVRAAHTRDAAALEAIQVERAQLQSLLQSEQEKLQQVQLQRLKQERQYLEQIARMREAEQQRVSAVTESHTTTVADLQSSQKELDSYRDVCAHQSQEISKLTAVFQEQQAQLNQAVVDNERLQQHAASVSTELKTALASYESSQVQFDQMSEASKRLKERIDAALTREKASNDRIRALENQTSALQTLLIEAEDAAGAAMQESAGLRLQMAEEADMHEQDTRHSEAAALSAELQNEITQRTSLQQEVDASKQTLHRIAEIVSSRRNEDASDAVDAVFSQLLLAGFSRDPHDARKLVTPSATATAALLLARQPSWVRPTGAGMRLSPRPLTGEPAVVVHTTVGKPGPTPRRASDSSAGGVSGAEGTSDLSTGVAAALEKRGPVRTSAFTSR